MIIVRYYETATKRKQEKVFGEFYPEVEIKEVRPVDETLKGKNLAADKERYENEVAEAILKAKFTALDKVREIVGPEGVLVANIVEEGE